MNWKKWDENTWVNVVTITGISIWHDKKNDTYDVLAFDTKEGDYRWERKFKTRAEAVAFIEELIK